MAIVTTKSTTIANRDASPSVINDGRLERGVVKKAKGSAAIGAADSATSYYPLAAVPSSAIVHGVLLSALAGMTTFAGNVGVFLNTKASGGVALGTPAFTGSGSFFAAAQSMATVLSRSDVTNQSLSYTAAKREQPLWQAIGMAADPMTTLDIGVTCTTANTGTAGSIALEVEYSDNGS